MPSRPSPESVADDHAADPQALERAEGRVQVVGEDAGLQAVAGVVDPVQSVLIGLDRAQRDHRAEHLVGVHLGVGRDVCQDRRRVRGAVALATHQDPGAGGHRLAHPPFHAVRRLLVDQRAHVGGRVGRVADVQRVHLSHDPFGQSRVDVRRRVHALDGDARLAGLVHAERRVAAQLQGHVLAGCAVADLPAHRPGTGERDDREPGVGDQPRGLRVGHRQHRPATLRQVRLGQQLSQQQRGQRGPRRRLEDHRRPDGQRRGHLVPPGSAGS
jgi:hypothetical protein